MINIECCGGRHATPFCPLCGKKLKERSPIDALLCHLAREIKKKRGFVMQRRRLLDEPGTNQLKVEIEISRMENTIQNWESWREAIYELRARSNQHDATTESTTEDASTMLAGTDASKEAKRC